MSDGRALAQAWSSRGQVVTAGDERVWRVDTGPVDDASGPAVVLVHGFPTCSLDWRHLVTALAPRRRVIAMDLPGYGLSAKPDRSYPLERQADVVVDVVRAAGVDEVDLVTHDMGDTVGGAVLARDLERDDLGFGIRRRVLTNGSIYIAMANLTSGQRLGLRLPDRQVPRPGGPVLRALYRTGIRRIFGDTPLSAEDADALWWLMSRNDGHRLLPRLIRYIEERRVHEGRWTGAIETHPSPVDVVWGALDPVAGLDMAHRFVAARPDANLVVLDGVGHFPMVEAPDRFNEAVLAALEVTP